MIQVEINDEAMEAERDESLLSVARRNGAHIGFYCDGNGLCTMCECRILSGAEHLTPPNEAEHTWLPQARMADGYRLGCQAGLSGTGPVRALTRAEELRRQLAAVLSPPTGSTGADQARLLLENVAAVTWEHLGTFPVNLLQTLRRLGPVKFLLPLNDLGLFAGDTARITRRMLGGPGPRPAERKAVAALPDKL